MPPKTRGTKSDWQECTVCSTILQTKDASSHEKCCQGTIVDSQTGVLTSYTHDHIRQNTLLGTVKEYVHQGGEIDRFTVSTKASLLFMNPSCMKLCHIGIKDLVLATQMNGSQDIYTAWPVPNINPTSVCFSVENENKYELGSRVMVSKYGGDCVGAMGVFLEGKHFDQKTSNQEEVLKCLKRKFCNKFVKIGSVLHCLFYGQKYSFVVKEIHGEDGEVFQSELDELSVSQSLSRLQLQDDTENDASTISLHASGDFETLSQSTHTSTPLKQKIVSDMFQTPRNLGDSFRSKNEPQFYKLKLSTKLQLSGKENKPEGPVNSKVMFDQIGGLFKEIKLLRELIEMPIKFLDTFQKFGLKPPRGLLLSGPPGTGKTLLAKAVSNELSSSFIIINGPEVYSKYYGETEARLRNIFKDAVDRSPSVIFIDEIDALCPKREGGSEQETRVVATLLTLIDSLPTNGESWVFLIAATNKPNSLDPALRQPGRFDKEIEIGVPNSSSRLEIYKALLQNVKHSLTSAELEEIARSSHGFTGADIASVCSEAALHSLKSHVSSGTVSDQELAQRIVITLEDFMAATKLVKPSAMREIALEVTKVKWSDIGGMAEVKHKLRQAVEWPLKYEDTFKRLGIKPSKGLLMYGPPGCSKTMIAKALATESELNFIAIKGPELFSKWVGESERAVRELFRKARLASPCIVFFDEIDALAAQRGSTKSSSNVGDRVIAQLLAEIDGIEQLKDVTLIAATNRPDMIDEALMRPGRLDTILYVPLPDLDTRMEIFRIQLQDKPIHDDVSVSTLASKTSDYSGAEVVAVCQEAALKALEENLSADCIKWHHFEAALNIIQPRISSDTIRFYENYKSRFKSVHAL